MCLLVVAFRVIPGTPLLVGADRDEFLDRPATSMTVLRPRAPRILGGRDERSGGTWLAINEHGVFAGLTNQPLEAEEPARRTRGELPLALASHADARRGVDAFLQSHRPSDYNGAWLLTGDRDAVFFIDFTGLAEPRAIPLEPGVHILENRPLGAPSAKVDHVVSTLGPLDAADTAISGLHHVLADHFVPPPDGQSGGPKSASNCVHLDGYGTRSACILRVTEDRASPPQVSVADGPPCATPFVDVSHRWTSASPSRP